MKKIIAFIFLFFLFISFAFLLFNKDLFNFELKQIPKIEKNFTKNVIEKFEKNINTTYPLFSKENALDSFLTKDGILRWTNIQRYKTKSLPALLQNDKLDEIAMKRVEDMFSKQYFEHLSPQGIGASNIAKEVRYEFISIGENIALGNFKDDKILVQAWMDSPGHRANILNDKYTEIGIAVKKDFYQGHQTWIGVQIFARPISACPQINTELKTELNNIQNKILTFKNDAITLEKEIKNINPINKKRIKEYNQKVDAYNSILNKINNLIKKQKVLIINYNNQVEIFNKCVKE